MTAPMRIARATPQDLDVVRGLIDEAADTMATRPNPQVWAKSYCECDLSQRAVCAHRLISARNYTGWGLEAELINWTGLRARREYGATWIKIDVWTTNTGLHGYYKKRGFEPCGFCPDRTYPSGALFQKPVTAITGHASPLFILRSGNGGPFVPAHRR